ncbi:MAG: FAD-dependent oxidoreductase, partial [Bdellovibrionota bacterium]
RYFSLSSRWTGSYSSLLYPVPDPAGGLGVHLTFDLAGKCRLGPDVDWGRRDHADPSDPELYHFEPRDEDEKDAFFKAGARLLPGLLAEDITPDYIGVRPKLFVDGLAHPDFMIRQSIPGRSGDWHLLGIESPGLTAALALAAEFSPKIVEGL